MKKLIVFVKRRQGMSFEQFRDHYENAHIPLNATWIGHLIADFIRIYPRDLQDLMRGEATGETAAVAGCDYDAVSIYTFKDEADVELTKIAQDPEFQRTIIEDEERFCDRRASRMGFATLSSGIGINGA